MKIRVALVCLPLLVVLAQQAGKRPLTHKDYDSWRSIQTPTLSRDGRFLAYSLMPQEGDGAVVVRDLRTGQERRHEAGALPPPPETNIFEIAPGEEPPRTGVRLAFTSDHRFLVFSTLPSKAETDQAKKDKKEAPKNGLAIMDLASGVVTAVARVKSFQVPEKGGSLIAYLKEPKPEEKPAEAKPEAKQKEGEAKDQRRRPATAGSAPTRGPRAKEYGSELVLRDLRKPEPNERAFQDALEYSLSKDGQTLVYTVSSKKEETNGVYAVATSSDAAPVALLSGKGKYTKLVWDLKQSRLAFLSDRDDAAAKQPKYKLYLWERASAAPAEIVSTSTPGFRSGFVVSDRGAVSFSRDGSRLFLGSSPPPPPESDGEASSTEEKVSADLWHWRDPMIQPMQKVRANQERYRSYRGVFHIAEKKFIQLADATMPGLLTGDGGRYAIGTDDRPYRQLADFDASYVDYYLVDLATGARKKLLEKAEGGGGGFGGFSVMQWSPDSRYALYYRDRNWHAISVDDGKITNLTASVTSNFYNEEDDHPAPPPNFGSAGWTKDSRYALIYDKFDVWQISPDGRTVKNLTDAAGRRDQIQFRVVRLEREDDEDEPRGLDSAKPLLLRAENLETRDSGFYRDRIDSSAAPEKIFMRAKNYRALGKAKDADVILLTESDFNQYPDLRVTDSSFRELRQVSDGNPQKAQFVWGTGELVRYKNADGVPLKAVLFTPGNFDPNKKYPMLVYIYERLSQGVRNFVDPRPGTSINISYYVSNGYLVLEPDIAYTVGYPGQSALKCVLPAIQAVVDRGIVDENAIGIQGHSWGGYQTAYMVTQTRRFRAAAAGAPVGDMISAYNGIRWGSGMPRQFQYERTQSRIGGSIWQYPMRFLENSPIFFADRVETPMLILHNDQDDAVPWYQGIELFLSLRRNGKEAYMFVYNGEPHGIRKRVNQKDYTVRMQQFFDHFLKGAPKPEWMEKGIPYRGTGL